VVDVGEEEGGREEGRKGGREEGRKGGRKSGREAWGVYVERESESCRE
jgi:hypothetical protein